MGKGNTIVAEGLRKPDEGSVRLSTRHPGKLLSTLAERGALEGLQVRGATLEDVFLKLTGRECRA